MNRNRKMGMLGASTEVGNQRGRTALVTGANTGIGFVTARVLAEHGATVVLACRDIAKADDAAARIRTTAADATITTQRLDLVSLRSVREAAGRIRSSHPRLDLLINNAGLMIPPYGHTEDGFELQFGVNHLGHFALTGLLLETLLATPGSRIITVSSIAHRRGAIQFDDLQFERTRYRPAAAYAQSKLANLMFTYELQRRLAAAAAPTIAVAAHPGVTRTDLVRHGPAPYRAVTNRRLNGLTRWFMQDANAGALPTLRAAVDPAVSGGDYYGPAGWKELTGHPIPVGSSRRSHDSDAARRLWAESERLTGVTYKLTAASA